MQAEASQSKAARHNSFSSRLSEVEWRLRDPFDMCGAAQMIPTYEFKSEQQVKMGAHSCGVCVHAAMQLSGVYRGVVGMFKQEL